MIKNIITSAVSVALISTLAFAEKSNQPKDGRGFAFYENGKDDEKNIVKLLGLIYKEQKEQTRIQSEILAHLKDVADVPKMVKINGKECLANSSADCFVMPITGDAKRIPVMRKWIEDPTMENAIEYFKWQSKYLNKIFNSGYAYHFATMSIDTPFKGIPNYMEATGGYEATNQLKYHTMQVIKSKARNMKIFILLGENSGFDIENNQKIFQIYENFKKLGIGVKYVFKTQKKLEEFNKLIASVPTKLYQERWNSVSKSDKVVSKNTFDGGKNIEVHITPMYVLKYDDMKNKKHFSQVIGAGKDDFSDLMETLPRSLIYWDVVKPSEFSTSKSNDGQLNQILEALDNKTLFEDKAEKQRTKEYKEMIEKKLKESTGGGK